MRPPRLDSAGTAAPSTPLPASPAGGEEQKARVLGLHRKFERPLSDPSTLDPLTAPQRPCGVASIQSSSAF
ncbi:hypothetical protein BOO71_0006553 [Deinococcus marmoris]|uniref:Uncharacterized protein n=1 Tax=Deinococcus marmoris TaxID=249408 RepID=A0A1U7NZ24_9DEIO|nr:hypothetical protein BOO71_0006553 [Deinococcus marmoris]